MPKKLVWVKQSQDDLDGVIEYIAFHDSVDTAITLFENVTEKAEQIIQFPNKGRIVPELKHIGVTSFLEQIQTPYRIIYKEFKGHIAIIAFLDGRRDLAELLIARASKF